MHGEVFHGHYVQSLELPTTKSRLHKNLISQHSHTTSVFGFIRTHTPGCEVLALSILFEAAPVRPY